MTCMNEYILEMQYKKCLLCKFRNTQKINNKYSIHNLMKNTKNIKHISDLIRVRNSVSCMVIYLQIKILVICNFHIFKFNNCQLINMLFYIISGHILITF